MRNLIFCLLALITLGLSGCITPGMSGNTAAQVAQREAIMRETPGGDYFVGRRYYNPNYKFWGYIRKPGDPWHSAKLVVLNEKEKLAPDREVNQFGVDDNCEYRIHGRFTGERVYEPASNRFYPEFLLTNYELLDRNPPSIFPVGAKLPSTIITEPN